ncbi:MAG: histidine kinase [Pseudomonadota bacterium]
MNPPSATSVSGAKTSPQTFWRQYGLSLVVAAVGAVIAALAFSLFVRDTLPALLAEMSLVATVLLAAFWLAGAWRQTWVPRWLAQVIAVIAAAPLAPLIVHLVSVDGDLAAFMGSRSRVVGFWWVTVSGATVGLLVTLAALYRERDAQARAEALQFALERETLMRQATDARLNLLQAQIEPHFLLNTLANVQELVESGSPRAGPVFKSLIAYLRATMPQLHQEGATLGQEADLVRAYLELMLMRMPDRLQFSVDVETSLRGLRFPSMALLTLVENAVHHGIDPSCDGGHIAVGAQATPLPDGSQTLRLWVADTGLGLSESANPGVGLANLRARLQAFYATPARLELCEQTPHGVKAEIIVEGLR